MNIQRIKGLIWIGAAAVGGTLGYEVWNFLDKKAVLEQYVPEDVIVRKLYDEIDEPEPIKANVVDVGEINTIFHDMDWSGKPPAVKPPPGPKPGEVTGPPKTPVSELLKILVIQVDGDSPDESKAYVKYLDKTLERVHNEPKERFLKIGQHLTGKFQDIEVVNIEVDGVTFAFGDDRPDEKVTAAEYTATEQIVVVGPDGVIEPKKKSLIPTTGYRPTRSATTVQTGRNEYEVGTDVAAELEANYSAILSRDLSYRPARDPSNGSIRGLQVTKVVPGSLPAQHGITEGEIIKSINGHKVTSVSDAVAFVKKEAPTTDLWEVVVEMQGREFTRTYRSPQE